MVNINIVLPSGRSEAFSVRQTSKVELLRRHAENKFGQCFLRLVTAEGRILTNHEDDLQAAGHRVGKCLVLGEFEWLMSTPHS